MAAATAATPLASVANHVTSADERMVLIDSGANEVIRPFRPELAKQLQKLSAIQVALASGETVSAYRTKDGELILPVAAGASAEWIVPLERLTAGLKCNFSWNGDDSNPTLHVPQESGVLQPVQVIVKNRLPYISWTDFQPLRRRLAKLWQGKHVKCLACQAAPATAHPGPLPSSSSSEQGAFCPTASPGRGPEVSTDGQPDLRPESGYDMEELHSLGKKLIALGFETPSAGRLAEQAVPQCSSCKAAAAGVIDLEDDDDAYEGAEVPASLCPEKAALKKLQDRCQQGLYDRQCETCLKSKGYRRPHRKLAAESISNGVLSMDLSGPHPGSLDGHKYMLVTALRLANGTVLPFVKTLPNKESSTALPALLQIMAQIYSMTGGMAVYFRVHSDCGGEFTATHVVEQIHALGIWKTTTAAHSPESNGVAERMVQSMKDDATRCLLHSHLPLYFWTFAARHNAFAARQRALGLPIPESVPKLGQKVLVRKVNPDSFSSRLDEAVFLCEDETVPNGALVLIKRDSSARAQIVKTRMPIISPFTEKKWRLESKDEQRVWVSSKGDLQWEEPAEWKEQMTFEERSEGPGMTKEDVLKLVRKQMGNTEPSWEDFCEFGHGYLLSLDSCSVAPTCKAVKPAVPQETQKNKYYILPFEVEEEMNKTEVDTREMMATAETVPQTVLWSDDVSEEERAKWFHGLQTELDTMTTGKQVLREVTCEEARDVWGLGSVSELPTPVPSKLVLTRKPDVGSLPCETSAAAACKAAMGSWKARVRLVACGNYQEDTQAHVLENSSANPSQELLRLLLSMLARHPDWTALVLDISCAFLNAVLGDERVLIRPPPALIKLGLIAPNVLWMALRAIYGLRKAPKLWEEERNRMLDHRVLKQMPGSKFGDVTLKPLESRAWVMEHA